MKCVCVLYFMDVCVCVSYRLNEIYEPTAKWNYYCCYFRFVCLPSSTEYMNRLYLADLFLNGPAASYLAKWRVDMLSIDS